MKRVVALAFVLVACRPEHIVKERFVREVETPHVGMVDEGPRGLAGHAMSRFDGECEPGEVRSCGWSVPPPARPIPGYVPQPLMMHCYRDPYDGKWTFRGEDCATPLVIAWDDAPVRFERLEGAFPVGPYERTEWPSSEAPWLALDRDGSGCIEGQGELFAGFAPLAELDANADGRIDARDPAYAELVLWSDANGDKQCAPSELGSLASAGIVSIDLESVRPKREGIGSYEGERASVITATRRHARIVDVYLAPLR